MRKASLMGIALACAMVLAACQTPYMRKVPGFTVGYSEIQIDETTYQVRFDGNGNTPKEKVHLYWLYRCAELTEEKGYELFALAIPPKHADALDLLPRLRPASLRIPADGAHREAAAHLWPAYFVYIPGGRITTWHSRAVMRIFHELPPDVPYGLRAQSVLDMLHDYVTSEGDTPAPATDTIIKLALVRNPHYAGPATEPEEAGAAPLPDAPPPAAAPAQNPPPAADEQKLQKGQKAF